MDTKFLYCKPEIWGGIECTINRVKNNYRDQLQMAGHYSREGDIERFAELGIRKLRYPVLWEYHQSGSDKKACWRSTEQRLNLIRKNKMTVIAGLLHHGSGPAFTCLDDKNFAQKLANYARQCAEKFPWINDYTPVNEPLTTARFSGLYGLWYPHMKNELSFMRMLLNQVKGTVLSMQAIRKINPAANLIQTEDLGKTHSTPLLSYQAHFENERRWLTYDLLCGKLNKDHFFWNYLIALGIGEKELQFFLDNPCPPAVMGFNYYVTSERYLDENLDNYASFTHGGNGRHAYADTEAVRAEKSQGIAFLLMEAWQRYNIPLAITECHLSCTREEQMRWLKEVWDACCYLKKEEQVNIQAVTAWSLLGAFDWNSLLTATNHYYEPGVFDISKQELRPTALRKMIRSLAANGDYHHPVFAEKGWWHSKNNMKNNYDDLSQAKSFRPLLILGKTGTLGHAFEQICKQRKIPFIALGRQDVNISIEESLRAVIDQYKPWAIINATGYVRVDEAEANPDECFFVNAIAPAMIARLCDQKGIMFMSFSSDLVFDGQKRSPYYEGDPALPLNTYGYSKSEGEKLILKENSDALIIRTSAFFGPWDKYNFVSAVLDALKQKNPFLVPDDVIISPTYVPDLCHSALNLLIDEEKGICHITNDGIISWAGFGEIIAERSGDKKSKLIAMHLDEMGWPARRPKYSVLQSDKGIRLPPLDNALDRYFENRTA